ncbi:MAG: energy-coupling factor ABC transporter ATP-binding protein [Thermotogota bacterium]|nr:energy-coupling factor ABC transporter ATP-binding protein [Thermotogota bacterium]
MFPSSSETLAEMKEIIVRKNNRTVLGPLTLNISKGEYVGIIGRNGSGKTTLLQSMAGVTKINKGHISTCESGYVFQNPDNQIIGSTVFEDIKFSIMNLGIIPEEEDNYAETVLKEHSFYSFKDRDTLTLSGGQKQKLSLVSVLAMKPKLLLLDEPFSMLDRIQRHDIQHFINSLNSKGITLVVAGIKLYDLIHCKRIILLDEGKIIFDGPMEDISKNTDLLNKSGILVPEYIG